VIRVSEPIRHAHLEGRPIVALESNLIAHGLPSPANLETATAMEAAIREYGAVPATVGIIAGRPIIGLSPDQLELLATTDNVAKASRRDLAVLVAQGAHGATTVSATLALMARADPAVRVLTTGGIGGVHHRAEATFDISSDLVELGRARAVVVCSGAKAILDLARTVELLETLGVTILGYRTDEFPAFYSSGSGLPVNAEVADASEAAAVTRARWQLELKGAVILAVPPPPAVALSTAESAAELQAALAHAETAGVCGRQVTPYLLSRVADSTGGRSLAANRALLVNNARVAATVAAELAQTCGGAAVRQTRRSSHERDQGGPHRLRSDRARGRGSYRRRTSRAGATGLDPGPQP
jgi:pseudouridine-5'-phosphate glycosidase